MISVALLFSAVLDFESAFVKMERAVVTGDEATLERLASEFRAALDDGNALSDPRLAYAFAYASWRLASFHERGSKRAERLLKASEKELKEILETSPNDAEAHALYGTVNGWLITGMWSGMRRGPRADESYRRARELAADNPRVAMFQGTSRLFRPGAFGGGVDKAETELLEALELFELEPADKPWPNTGHAEIRVWLGQVMVEKGKLDEARDYYEQALELEPDYQWVREELLPELDTMQSQTR